MEVSLLTEEACSRKMPTRSFVCTVCNQPSGTWLVLLIYNYIPCFIIFRQKNIPYSNMGNFRVWSITVCSNSKFWKPGLYAQIILIGRFLFTYTTQQGGGEMKNKGWKKDERNERNEKWNNDMMGKDKAAAHWHHFHVPFFTLTHKHN